MYKRVRTIITWKQLYKKLNTHLKDSVQYVFMRSEKPIGAPPRRSEVSRKLPLKQLQCSSNWRWPSLVNSKIVEHLLYPCLSPPGDRCWVFGFMPVESVTRFSTLQVFKDASYLLWMNFPTSVYRPSHSLLQRNIQKKNTPNPFSLPPPTPPFPPQKKPPTTTTCHVNII